MEIELQRLYGTSKNTFGIIRGATPVGALAPICYTLEDAIRVTKIPGATCVFPGRYEVIINLSRRFKTELPLLVGTTEFSGVRIHTGNTAEDTEGCILCGMQITLSSILQSRDAQAILMKYLREVFAKEKVWITVKNPK